MSADQTYSSLCKGAIENIFSNYRNESAIISQDEIKGYVKQVDVLQEILDFSKTGFIILDYEGLCYRYCSPNLQEVLGQTSEDLLKYGPAFGISKIYEKDLPSYEKIALEAQAFYSGLPPHERNEWRLSFTFRVVHPDGHHIETLQNMIILKWGDNGKPLMGLLILADISAYKSDHDAILNISHIERDGSCKLVVHKRFSETDQEPLTALELEIVGMIANGSSVKELSDHFSRSPNTMRNHKKTIMAKLGCSNSAQMVTLAKLYGILQPEPAKGLRHAL